MLDKRVRIPMLAGIVVYGVSIILRILCALCAPAIVKMFSIVDYEGRVFSLTIIGAMFRLTLYTIFYYVMNLYTGKNKRMVGILMLIAYCFFSIVENVFLNRMLPLIAAYRGAETMAALLSVSQLSSLVTLPFTLAAGVLIVMSIGRFGVIGELSAKESINI